MGTVAYAAEPKSNRVSRCHSRHSSSGGGERSSGSHGGGGGGGGHRRRVHCRRDCNWRGGIGVVVVRIRQSSHRRFRSSHSGGRRIRRNGWRERRRGHGVDGETPIYIYIYVRVCFIYLYTYIHIIRAARCNVLVQDKAADDLPTNLYKIKFFGDKGYILGSNGILLSNV